MAYRSLALRILKWAFLPFLCCICTLCALKTAYLVEYLTADSRLPNRRNAEISQPTSGPTWKTVLPLWLYVYSAYARLNNGDGTSATITVTAIASREIRHTNVTVKCDCLYREILVDAVIKKFPDDHELDYSAAAVLCDVTHSLLKNSAFLKLRCRVGNITGSVELYVPESPSQNQAKHGFGICGPIVFGTDIKVEHVIQFVEYYQLMGSAKYIFYTHQSIALNASSILRSNATTDLMKVLHHYENLGRLQLVNWTLPSEVEGKVHYNAQIAALNECMLRVAGYWRYAVVVDFDEYIISRKGAVLETIMANPTRDCLTIRMSAARSPAGSLKPPFLRISRNITRETFVWNVNDRSKYICRPDKVVSAAIHYIDRTKPNTAISVADPNETLVLHFSGDSVPRRDDLINFDLAEFFDLVHQDRLTENVLSAYKQMFIASAI